MLTPGVKVLGPCLRGGAHLPENPPVLEPAPVVDTPSPCVTSASSFARDIATLLIPCGVHSRGAFARQPPGLPLGVTLRPARRR